MNARVGWLLSVVTTGIAVSVAGATVVSETQTPSHGTVEAVCDDAKGWKIELTASGGGGRDIVTIRMSSPVACVPPPLSIRFGQDGKAVQHVWTCNYMNDAYHLWPDAWKDRKYSSQLAFGTPIAVAFDGDERAHLAMACSEVFNKVEYSLRVKENTCRLLGEYRLFTQAVNPISAYEAKILLDSRTRFWAEAVADASAWIGEANGFRAAEVPESARDPLYSTWYAYWQDVHAAPLEREAKMAADLGMKTMILDDGWQKVESASFYSATGDWMPVASRFPDMKAHVARVHAAGLKYMLWLSVPYVGDESQAWKRFEKKMLYVHGNKSPGRIGVLDPRFPDVRAYLVATYERVVGDWGFDGVKLDFIDQFVLQGRQDPAVKDNYAGRDIKSVPEAVDRLLTDVLAHLRKINPEVLVEFRQSYMGPAILKYGNMIRAADCPADPWSNRKRICDLRLTSGKTAVHSDMIVWSRTEDAVGAALPILNALFGTIQYSMILARAPKEHAAVIRHWIAFSQAHREALLKGTFRPRHPEANYPVIEAESAAERVVAVYNALACVETGARAKTAYLVNATRRPEIIVNADGARPAEVYDTFGRRTGALTLKDGLQKVAVPAGGYLKVRAGWMACAGTPSLERIADVRILKGDARTAYRDPAVWYEDGTFHLFFTLVETEADKSVFSYVATVSSRDLVRWSPLRKLTPRDGSKDYSSPGNVVADGSERVLCLQSYPRPGNRDDGVVRFANQTARLFTMRSRDLRNWSAPKLLKVKGPDVAEQDMGRMIDPYLLRDRKGAWWCFYKQRGASIARSDDLENWTPVGRTDAGENACVLEADGRYVMFHSPKNGIGCKTSADLVHWKDAPGLITLGQKAWPWAAGRLTAGAVLDARKIPGLGKYLLFFHGSGPRTESEGDFDRNASIGLAWSDDLANWSWPGRS